jgi:hypothetical protein
MLEQELEAFVGFFCAAKTAVLAHRPDPLTVHVWVEAAGVRVLAGNFVPAI